MSELTPEKVAAFLNRRTGGFVCSVCEANEWQMNVSDKECDRIEITAGTLFFLTAGSSKTLLMTLPRGKRKQIEFGGFLDGDVSV